MGARRKLRDAVKDLQGIAASRKKNRTLGVRGMIALALQNPVDEEDRRILTMLSKEYAGTGPKVTDADLPRNPVEDRIHDILNNDGAGGCTK